MRVSLFDLCFKRCGPTGKEWFWEVGLLGVGHDSERWLFRTEKHFEWYRLDILWFTLFDDYADFITDFAYDGDKDKI